MRKRIAGLALCIAAFAISVAAQTVTGTEFTPFPADTFTDSPNTMSNYGLTWADYSNGTIGDSAMLSGWGGINLYTGGARRLTITATGNVGIGTTVPTYQMMVGNGSNVNSIAFFSRPSSTVNLDIYSSLDSGTNSIYGGFGIQPTEKAFIVGATGAGTAGWYQFFINLTNGNVGIGTTAPGSKLEVNGSVKLTSGSGGSMTFADGTVQSTAWTGAICGGDYAESVDVTGDRKHYRPGDVLVIDPSAPGKFLKSAEPYSTAVMGVYSTKPGVLGRRQTTAKSPDEVPMAMVGIVPTKVSAENGAIRPGDLLVTSSTLGYAMKGTDRSRMLGAVIGKALSGLDSGTGVIEVGVTLQ